MERANGYVAYIGPSVIDPNVQIMLILTGIDNARKEQHNSANSKTGAMVQSYIMRVDMPPLQALAHKSDDPICGSCIHSATNQGTCYVNVFNGPTIVYKAFLRNAYVYVDPHLIAPALHGLPVRLGTYGDPAAIPSWVWQNLLSYVDSWTGYTHQWKHMHVQDLRQWCMASCDTKDDVVLARDKGWRPFYVSPKGKHAPRKLDVAGHSLKLCPASEEGGKLVQCSTCLQCNGTKGKTDGIYIPVHGVSWKIKRYTKVVGMST